MEARPNQVDQPECLPRTRFSCQRTWMENNLDEMWGLVCDDMPPVNTFTRQDVVAAFMRRKGWTERTAQNYASACLAYWVALPEGGLFKVPGKRYRFHDENGM